MWKVLMLVATVFLARAQELPPGVRCPQRVLVFFEFGENAANAGKFRTEHLDYMHTLMKAGKVIYAGPMEDKHTAATLFATKDFGEVDQLLAKEPFYREHVLKVVSRNIWNACELAP